MNSNTSQQLFKFGLVLMFLAVLQLACADKDYKSPDSRTPEDQTYSTSRRTPASRPIDAVTSELGEILQNRSNAAFMFEDFEYLSGEGRNTTRYLEDGSVYVIDLDENIIMNGVFGVKAYMEGYYRVQNGKIMKEHLPVRATVQNDGSITFSYRKHVETSDTSFSGSIVGDIADINFSYSSFWAAFRVGHGFDYNAHVRARVVLVSLSELPPLSPKNVQIRESSDHSLTITWEDPDTSNDEKEYVIYRSIGFGNLTSEEIGTSSETSFIDDSPEAKSTTDLVLYSVKTRSSNGKLSNHSEPQSISLLHRLVQL